MSRTKRLSRAPWTMVGMAGMLILLGSGVATATTAGGTVVLTAPQLYDTALEVLPGSLVSLHWSSGADAALSGLHFLVSSNLPGFSSAPEVEWPPRTSPSPTWTGTAWTTTAQGVSVAVPVNAVAGSQYTVAFATCDSAACSPTNSVVLTVPTSPTNWKTIGYQSAYPHVATFATPGQPFATTFLASDNSIWNASEFSHDVVEIKGNGTAARGVEVVSPKGSSSLFRTPFADCGSSPCIPSAVSAQSEQVITSGGDIWLTFGGWRWDRSSAPPNHSEVVAFDPATKKFCTYLVPGNNNEIAGIAVTGSGTHSRVWFVESRGSGGHPSLDAFDPSAVGEGCDGRSNEAYVLPGSVELLTWPSTGGQWPAQIAVDPSSPTLWITDFDGYAANGRMYSDIDQVNISDPVEPKVEHRYVIPSTNPASLFGPKPWYIVAPPHSDDVYAIDNGDNEIVRLNKVTGQMDELPIPLTSDFENGFGLALSSGRLYFTLADDYPDLFGAASAFGYVTLSSWTPGSSHADGVIYSGLPAVTDPGTKADYRAIAIGPTGQVAITDKFGMIRLTPGP